jgi:hypothetical protein
MIQHSPACERNKEPILQVLQRVLDRSTSVLEIAAGTGMHAVFMAAGLPHLVWQPTDMNPQALLSIQAWLELQPSDNLRPPMLLDTRSTDWPAGEFDAIFNANMIHIAPWTATQGLLAGAGRILPAGGLLVGYGPYKLGGAHTAPSNERFDQSLQARDPQWGVRDLEKVAAQAEQHGLVLEEQVDMPANNQMVVFRRR